MKCEHCKLEYSDSVWAIHVLTCEGKEVEHVEKESTEESIRLKAKELGIKKWHVKSVDNLIAEIKQIDL